MRVSEDLLQTVAFIGSRQKDGTFQANATGFFVSVAPDYPYLVTAQHVAKHLVEKEQEQNQSYVMRFNPQPYLRANEKLAGLRDMEIRKRERWYTHPEDSNIDIAVLPLASLSPRLLAHKTIPTSMFFSYEPKVSQYTPEEAEQAFIQAYRMEPSQTSEQRKLDIIAIGDETHTVGLYSPVPGRKENVPVVRVGNVAMMPGEPIRCSDDVDRELYLIEMRSTAGLSGSPVFAVSPVTHTLFLIGIIHGHHTLQDDQKTRNTGIALVTPIKKLLDILESEDLAALRQQDAAIRLK